jgi:hypothetical protein
LESTHSSEAKQRVGSEVEISIGTVRIFATARDRLNILSPNNSSPWVMATVERSAHQWHLDSPPGFSINGKQQTAPSTLADELLTLGRTWAESHPEEFEREGDEEFDHLIGYIVNDSFDAVLEKMEEAEEDLAEALENSEFVLQASAVLRNRLEDAAKMLHAMKLQIDAAAEAIDEAFAVLREEITCWRTYTRTAWR